MRLLLIGANGQVGFELLPRLRCVGEVVATTRTGRTPDGERHSIALDVTDLDAIGRVIGTVRPDVVVNATAYTAVDRAEDEAELAFRVNSAAPRRMADACAQNGATFVHYSTDYVFDGRGSRPYREYDSTAPLGVYGASKLEGEQAVLAAGADSCILRTAWVFGVHGSNFLTTMLRLARERDVLRVVDDQVGSPTSAALIADATTQLLCLDKRPRMAHLVAGGMVSWHGYARFALEQAWERGMIPQRPEILPIKTPEFPTRAARPAYSVLDTSVLREGYGIAIPPWEQEVTETLDRLAARG